MDYPRGVAAESGAAKGGAGGFAAGGDGSMMMLFSILSPLENVMKSILDSSTASVGPRGRGRSSR